MLGALNLGDASTQMTFVLPAQEALTKSGMKAVAFGHSYNLYSHSHLCYGVATIQARYLARLTQGSDLRKPVASPCHQSGLGMEVASDDIFQVPCVTSAKEDIMGPSIAKPSGAPAKIAFRGDYDAIRCGRAIEAVFADASFAGVYRPSVWDEFAAIHKLWEIVTSFKKANHSVKVTRTEFATAIDNFCTSNWTTV
ncbi:Ectonucleoside triphosphate diphosphohydrolase 3, partial [Taenia solium]|eukprot:TsM_001068600 transcript=TsM_001068600 gene=TsM_001068600